VLYASHDALFLVATNFVAARAYVGALCAFYLVCLVMLLLVGLVLRAVLAGLALQICVLFALGDARSIVVDLQMLRANMILVGFLRS
jgi:predicted membrane-bound spermidine synthase